MYEIFIYLCREWLDVIKALWAVVLFPGFKKSN
jgi:hypothetical protein